MSELRNTRIASLLTALLVVAPVTAFAATQPNASPAPSETATPGTGLSKTLVLAQGEAVLVSFVDGVNSDTATEGTQVPVQVTKEVDVDGMIAIPKGSHGEATLTKVEHSGGNGAGGKIQFNIDWVYSADGGKVLLSPSSNASENADRKGAASTAAILGWATLGIGGLFAHNLAHGNAAKIPSDKVFTVFVDHTVHVISTLSATAQSGFDN